MITQEQLNAFYKEGTYPRKHADQVARILMIVTDDQNIIAAGYLHDILEDTEITYNQLVKASNATVAKLVWEVTQTGNNEFKNLKSREAIMIKFADRLSNISNLPFDHKPDGTQAYLDKSIFWKV